MMINSNSDIMWNGSVVVSKKSATSATTIGDTETIQKEPIPARGPKKIMLLLPPSLIYADEWYNLRLAFEYAKKHKRLKDYEQELELVHDWCHQQLKHLYKKIVAGVIHDHTYHATSPPQLETLPEQPRGAKASKRIRRAQFVEKLRRAQSAERRGRAKVSRKERRAKLSRKEHRALAVKLKRLAQFAKKLRGKDAHKINERIQRAKLRKAFRQLQKRLRVTNVSDNDTLILAINKIKKLEEQAEKKLKKIIRLETHHQQLLNERGLENIV